MAEEMGLGEEDGRTWKATQSRDVVSLFNSCKKLVDRVLEAPIVIMGSSVRLLKENFVVQNNLVHILSDKVCCVLLVV